MIVLAGGNLVLPDRVLPGGSLVLDGPRIVAVEPRVIDTPEGATRIDLHGRTVLPGFVDVHVHGVEGIDVLDGPGSVAAIAARLPRYGVTAFCPTTVACAPGALAGVLEEIAALRRAAPPGAARVLPAHLESNFINPDFRGAQPADCLRLPPAQGDAASAPGAWSGADVLAAISAHVQAVSIVTLAPELPGGIDLTRHLSSAGLRVSIGHTGASYEETCAAIEAGACHVTHLFNRMTPMAHRAPGVPGAVLDAERVTAEVVCDGYHVHPAMVHLAWRSKGSRGLCAITDGTAGSGLPVGARARLGGRPIIVTERTAELEDGTMAGSVLTMDGALRNLVQQVGVSLVDAARMCAATPAAALGLRGLGRITEGAAADLVVLDPDLTVRQTLVGGAVVWEP